MGREIIVGLFGFIMGCMFMAYFIYTQKHDREYYDEQIKSSEEIQSEELILSEKENEVFSEFNKLGFNIQISNNGYYIYRYGSSTGSYICEEGNMYELQKKLNQFKGLKE